MTPHAKYKVARFTFNGLIGFMTVMISVIGFFSARLVNKVDKIDETLKEVQIELKEYSVKSEDNKKTCDDRYKELTDRINRVVSGRRNSGIYLNPKR